MRVVWRCRCARVTYLGYMTRDAWVSALPSARCGTTTHGEGLVYGTIAYFYLRHSFEHSILPLLSYTLVVPESWMPTTLDIRDFGRHVVSNTIEQLSRVQIHVSRTSIPETPRT